MAFRYDATGSPPDAKLVEVDAEDFAFGVEGEIHIDRAAVAGHVVDVQVALGRMADAAKDGRLQGAEIRERLRGRRYDVVAQLAVDLVAVECAIDLPLLPRHELLYSELMQLRRL